MTREELLAGLNGVIQQGDQLSTVVYAVMKETNDVKLLNIDNDEIGHIQEMFIDSIRNKIIAVEDQTILNVSEADDRANAIFEYDLDLPDGLAYLDGDLDDETLAFSFADDDLGDIDSLIIKIGTEERQLRILKKLSPVEVFGRGGYLLWKSNQRLEKFEDKVLRFTPSFNAIQVEDSLIFLDLKLLERSHGFHDVIVREANVSLQLVAALNLLDSTEGIIALLSNTSFARKVVKIKNSPVFRKNIPNVTIIHFTRTHPSLLNKMRYSEDGTRIILHTKRAKELFIKMLDDTFLTSELTAEYYESRAKDTVEVEEVNDAEAPAQ